MIEVCWSLQLNLLNNVTKNFHDSLIVDSLETLKKALRISAVLKNHTDYENLSVNYIMKSKIIMITPPY